MQFSFLIAGLALLTTPQQTDLAVVSNDVVEAAGTEAAGKEIASSKEALVEKPSAWETGPLVKTDKGQSIEIGDALYTKGDDPLGIIFTCTDGGNVLVAVSLEEADLQKVVADAGPLRSITVEYVIGRQKKATEQWVLLRRHGVVATTDPATTKKLYNAVVRGEKLRLDPSTRSPVEINLPEPDGQKFTSYAEECGFSAKKS